MGSNADPSFIVWARPVQSPVALQISSDRDDQSILGGIEIFDSGILGGRKIWQVFVWMA